MQLMRSVHGWVSAGLLGLVVVAGCGGTEARPPDNASSGTGGMAGAGGAGGAGGMAGAGGAGGAPEPPVRVQILGFNDFHGNLEPPPGSAGQITLPDDTTVDAGGAAYFAHHVASLRAENPNTVVVSAGDLIGGSPLLSALFHDEPTIGAMNLIGLDINAVGNHELDEGKNELLRMQNGGCHPKDGCQGSNDFPGASFAFLAANILDETTGKPLFPPYTVRTFEDTKVAFVGMTLKATPTIVDPSGIQDLSFLDEVETVNALVPELKAQGIETIVVLLHEGGATTGSFDACAGISGPVVQIATNMSDAVDVILSGHTHAAYNCMIGGKLVTSAASNGRLLTDIDLEISHLTGDVISKKAKNVVVTRDTAEPQVESYVNEYAAQVAPLAEMQVGTLTATLNRGQPPLGASVFTLGVVVADSMLAATKEPVQGGAHVAFMNAGGVRANLPFMATAGEATNGIVTYKELFSVVPFANSIVVMSLTGAELDALLEQQFGVDRSGAPFLYLLQPSSNFRYAYSASAPAGSKVDPASILIDGMPIDLGKTYRIAVNSYNAAGGDGFSVLTLGTERLGGALDIDALEAYFVANSPLSPPAVDLVQALP
ncbi:bifunctional metallophosphatase/5'-nucleotidase [Polyangium sorediatum]|uniref:Bifunctional metallophosphatase/5'-nucleotidase n=1 Tax=Polyangium sorediatum TaxID=889274 RepID=A0ABT6P4V9_9BACT|nr:bifunctional metallophosphatase/5'-nucleotidase [Polyangium sorediatum]MDI1435347.1 bifunctional metallophosphatase/5'-nucleotidase [Polyangium sorediatum]